MRVKLGKDLDLMSDDWKPVWVVDFPMFEWDEGEARWQALHHPFTAPKADQSRLLETCAGRVPVARLRHGAQWHRTGWRLDSYPPGGGAGSRCSICSGIEEEEAQEKFGFLLTALKYGCPPHGGLAFGLDRLVMLMSGAQLDP